MAQFDVYRRPNAAHLLLDVQSNILDELLTRACVPLQLKAPFLKPARQLNPEFVLEGETYVMMTHYIVSVPARDLRDPVTNLIGEEHRIKAAFDRLLFGI